MAAELNNLRFLSASPLAPPAKPSVIQADPKSYYDASILVRFQSHVDPRSAVMGANVAEALGLVDGLYELHLDPGVSVDTAIAAYRHDVRVMYAEPNYRIQVETLPNDPLVNQMYGLENFVKRRLGTSPPTCGL